MVIHELAHGIETDLMFGEFEEITDLMSPELLRQRGIPFSDSLWPQSDIIASTEGLKISEYATTNNNEYFAESFVRYMQGRTEVINSRYLNIFKQVAP